ncbi:MFS transporter [Devosia sp. J2-20]|jgi:MFS family permease|uniref:MFS transporter n=1 Tax=Devosia litorisediminis TaxID=2829817 RepID=A0A942E2Y3_9HYPH|nr:MULTISPECIES: MFS transporter [Devosia]MBS3847263.1 MFS transporter [Devosia litorisediminis]MCZ4346635.1 MFS transporter [Devosia neptuniae]WDQ99602.1 MFS transporter [Devosia sp. J2-20]|tara:strand:- start:1296 stop:2585 length:1290 start_codon:yes stop_codon:yes gene_type:complete
MSEVPVRSPLLAAGAILFSVALLIMGNGLQVMLLPIRGGIEGFSSFEVGMLGSGYFFGFVLGCAFSPLLIIRAGHIRTFAALVAIASAAALGYPVAVDPIVWVLLRMITGFCLSGLYLVVESWLNDQATNETRGTLISTYVTVNFTVITLGQMMVTLFKPDSFVLFSIASVLVSLAAVPIVMTRSTQPPPITIVRFRPKRMFRLSPTGTVSIFLIGVATGSFWSLGPTYANAASGSITDAALFMSAAVLGGALLQWPAGKISDHVDRRLVMIGLALASLMVGVVILVVPHVTWLWLVLGLAFGAGLLPAYAIAASHVFDFADRSDYVEISAGLLLLNGLGSTVGPLLTSLAIELFGPSGMFITNGVVMMVLIGFVAVRLSRREGLPEEEKENFDWGTAGAVSVVGDEEAVQLSDLVVQESDLVVQEPAA